MKKTYSTPEIEKVAFQYRDQVVVASGNCIGKYENTGATGCDKQEWVENLNN